MNDSTPLIAALVVILFLLGALNVVALILAWRTYRKLSDVVIIVAGAMDVWDPDDDPDDPEDRDLPAEASKVVAIGRRAA